MTGSPPTTPSIAFHKTMPPFNNTITSSPIAPLSPDRQSESSASLCSEAKYKKLKRKLREIMEINETMSKEFMRAKKKIRTLTFERNLLLDNIARMDNMAHTSDDHTSDIPSDLSETESELEHVPTTSSKTTRVTQRMISSPQRRIQAPYTKTSSALASPTQSPTRHPPPSNSRDQATVASAPPKRSKISRIPVKTRRVQPIERDEFGRPKLPQQIGVLTVIDLGKIVSDRDTFHNERYIFPVGYTVRRTYPSMIDPNSNTMVTSTILDGGDGPRFHVVAADMPDQPIIANSATGAWTVVVRRSNEIRQREHSNSASGPDYYGFKHPTIAKLIQDLPGTEDLRYYVRQNFEEMEPRAAKGVMAAAEKKRGNLEQMGNANRRAPRAQHPEHNNESDDLSSFPTQSFDAEADASIDTEEIGAGAPPLHIEGTDTLHQQTAEIAVYEDETDQLGASDDE